ncbi:MAG: 23S rRNA (pseudouridine(1915)-N(3))-methyltransferase RlmH [Clostridia bacterium]
MTEVQVIYVGNIKEKYYSDALDEFKKRLSMFCRFVETEIKEEKTDENESNASILKCLEKEGDKILAAIPKNCYKIALCVEGLQEDSQQFSKIISENSASQPIIFVIGSSHGLSEKVKAACDKRLSFSKMTLPHRLMRVVLYEQIYRAMTILAGKKYHK